MRILANPGLFILVCVRLLKYFLKVNFTKLALTQLPKIIINFGSDLSLRRPGYVQYAYVKFHSNKLAFEDMASEKPNFDSTAIKPACDTPCGAADSLKAERKDNPNRPENTIKNFRSSAFDYISVGR